MRKRELISVTESVGESGYITVRNSDTHADRLIVEVSRVEGVDFAGEWSLPEEIVDKALNADELPGELADYVGLIDDLIDRFLAKKARKDGGDPNRPRYAVWEYETVDGGDGLNFALGGKCALANTIGNARQRAYDLAGSRRGQKFAVVKPDGSIDVVWLAE